MLTASLVMVLDRRHVGQGTEERNKQGAFVVLWASETVDLFYIVQYG